MCDCDLERPTVWQEERRKARKTHICSECDRPIEPGTEYWWCKGLWGGKWGTYKTCPSCEEVAKISGLERCYEIGSLFSFLVESDDFWWEEEDETWKTEHSQLEIARQNPLLIVVKKT